MKKEQTLGIGLFLGLIFILSGCMFRQNDVGSFTKVQHVIYLSELQSKKLDQSHNMLHKVVTIWIHGTKITSTIIPIKKIKEFFNCELGLNKANSLHERYQMRKIAQTLIQQSPQEFPEDDFYFFGWSGKLSFVAREKAAQHLYRAPIRLIDTYQRCYNITPKIRIITHSHGGNVALKLADIQNKYDENLSIDELILLACPVQDETEICIKNAMFKKIYALYSKLDVLQIIDPQGIYKGKNVRTFFSRRYFNFDTKLKQAEITMERIAKLQLSLPLVHVEFILTDFIKILPFLIQEIDKWHHEIAEFVRNPHEHILQLTVKQ